MTNQSAFKNLLKDIFPFKNEYSLFIFGFIVLVCATFISIENYTGITLKIQNELVGSSHKIVWDTLFFLTTFSALYIFFNYMFKGFSKSTIMELRKHRRKIEKEKKSKRSPVLEATVLIVSYILTFIGFFIVPLSESSKSLWLFQGNIYVDLIFIFLLYSSFTLFTVVIVIAINTMRDK